MLSDLGVDRGVVERIEADLNSSVADILHDETLQANGVIEARLLGLIQMLESAMSEIESREDNRQSLQLLQGVLVALAGGTIVAVNALVGAGAIPVTGGLSIGGAALSGAVGQDLVTRGIDKAGGS